MKRCVVILLSLVSFVLYSQEDKELNALIVNQKASEPISNVNILNINKITGAVTDQKGNFTIKASVNDTLLISYIGFKSIQVRVTNDMFKIKAKITLTEMAYALDEIVLTPYKLTGDLYVDARNIAVNISPRYSISGLSATGYEARGDLGTVGQVLKAVSNPFDFLYNMFGSKGKQLRKLRKMRQNNEIRALLAGKFDRETLCIFLRVNKNELESIIRNCNYSKDFVINANDLQLLEAISDCYEEYRIMKKGITN